MSKSGRYITIKLLPWYQQFLRGWFDCDDPIFSFKKGNDILKLLGILTIKPPRGFNPLQQDFGEDTFRIELPWLEHKDPDVYSYISERGNTILVSHIRGYFKVMFHKRMSDLINTIMYDDARIDVFMEENRIDPKYRDSIVKEYNRWKRNETQKRYRRKKRKVTI